MSRSRTQRSVPPWSGRKVTAARRVMARDLPAKCGRCPEIVTADDAWVIGHIKDRLNHPELTWEPSNWQHEHRACSDASANESVREQAKAELLLQLQESGVDFSVNSDTWATPALPFSLPPMEVMQARPKTPNRLAHTVIDTRPEVEPRTGLEWDPEALRPFPWLHEFMTVPDDASPPLYMSRPSHDAVGSYGASAIEEMEGELGLTLRWWQRLAVTRQLEHRGDGSLCYRDIVESCPRRAGKSVRMRFVTLWRMRHAAMFGEVQTIVHTGSDVAICREIQRGAWRWAEDVAGWDVARANGKEAVESPDGDRWLVRSQTAVYGYDVCMGLVDEGWDVAPEVVSEGLEPAILERSSPQIHLTSTAHRRATSLMKTRISVALTTEVNTTLLLLWAARADADPADPQAWKDASPHWSEDRQRMIAGKYEAALAGELDPQADDLDPMEGFKAQYLNIWRLTKSKPKERGTAMLDADTWGDLAAPRPTGVPAAAAIESWFGPSSVALAWQVDGRAVVAVSSHTDLAAAKAAVVASGFVGKVTVGSSLATDPALSGLRVDKGEGRVVASAQALQRLVADDTLRHDGGEHLTGQVLALRTMPGTDGPRLVSTGRGDAVKAALWAVQKLRTTKPVGSVRILMPTHR